MTASLPGLLCCGCHDENVELFGHRDCCDVPDGGHGTPASAISELVRLAWPDARVRTRVRLDGTVVVSVPAAFGWAFDYIARAVSEVMGCRYGVQEFAVVDAADRKVMRLVLTPGQGVTIRLPEVPGRVSAMSAAGGVCGG